MLLRGNEAIHGHVPHGMRETAHFVERGSRRDILSAAVLQMEQSTLGELVGGDRFFKVFHGLISLLKIMSLKRPLLSLAGRGMQVHLVSINGSFVPLPAEVSSRPGRRRNLPARRRLG